jgi:hypothetical protein
MHTNGPLEGTYGWINGKETFIPEVRRSQLFPGEALAVVKGYLHTVAVLDAAGACIGWMPAVDVATSERPSTDDEVTRPC